MSHLQVRVEPAWSLQALFGSAWNRNSLEFQSDSDQRTAWSSFEELDSFGQWSLYTSAHETVSVL